MAGERHGRGMGTAWARQGNGMGAAWARHAICESAFIDIERTYLFHLIVGINLILRRQ